MYHISTDFVFDGTSGPYSENSVAGPIHAKLSWYGEAKYLGEKELSELIPSGHCIIRISYPYRANFAYKKDFARNVIEMYRAGRLFPLFSDQRISPTLIDDISSAIDFLIRKDARGIYHVASRDITTPFDFGVDLISKFFSIKADSVDIAKGSIREFNSSRGKRALRPVIGGLKTDKIAEEGFTPRSVSEGIDQFLIQIHEGRIQSNNAKPSE